MENKKRIVTTIGAMALTAVLAVGGTLAYLSAVTETATNTFSSSKNITTKLEEEFKPEEAENYTPGKVIAKVPTMTNTSAEESVWMAVSLDYTNGASSITYNEFKEYAEIQGLNTTDWTLIADAATGQQLFMYNTTLAPNAETNAIFTGVKVNAGIKEVKKFGTEGKIIYTKDASGKLIDVKDETTIVDEVTYYDAAGNVISATDVKNGLPTFEIVVKGFAVQESGVDKDTAASELITLAEKNLNVDFTAK